ncbi:MAG: hypothetical protein CVU59_09065 [Deltaproteobacteria bacterium HGW-Deltaproteobacteria-17]|nr:MAG: hypothetical protein CVU59_09065 [Deltaproteobacteria bacterium HGW-Deltaproteobacteria-17]
MNGPESSQLLEELHATLYSIGDAVITTDAGGLVRRMNPVAEQLTGWVESEARGRPLTEVFQIVGEDTGLPVENPVTTVLRHGKIVGLANHTLLISKDATIRPIADSGAPILNADGAVTGVVLVFRDQSAQRDQERHLAESEERFRSIFEHSPLGMHFYELSWRDELIFQGANPAAQRILGFDHGPLNGKTIEEAFPPLLQTEIPDRYRECVRHGIVWRTERMTYEDDRIVGCYRVTAFPTSKNHMVAMFEDITPIKQAEEELRASERRFRAIFNSSFQFVGLMTPAGIVIEANRTALDFAGIKAEEVVGKPMWEAFWWAEDNRRVERLRKSIKQAASGEFVRYDVKLRGRNGTSAFIDFSIKPIRDDQGNIVLLMPEGRDITAQRKAEMEREKVQAQFQHAQKMEAVGRLAGGVAHDFNNMLSVINGYTEILLSQIQTSNPMYADLQEIRNAGQRSTELVRQLLTFARRQPVEPRVLDINVTVTQLMKMIERLIGENIRIEWSPAVQACPVRLDPAQLDQILANLVVNARDAMPDGGVIRIVTRLVTVEPVEMRPVDARPVVDGRPVDGKPVQMIELAVSDNGSGMSAEILEHVFEPFFTTKETGRGTGLGLATVYGIVQQNHGTVSITSAPGRGTSVTIRLPVWTRPRETGEQATEPPPPQESQRYTVLLVEDEKAVLKIEQKMIEKLGFTVIATSDADEAVRICRTFPDTIHLLVTDVVMPKTGGLQLAEDIRKLRPGIRVLFMSGYSEEILDPGRLPEGEGHFIQKPFTVDGLSRKIQLLFTD